MNQWKRVWENRTTEIEITDNVFDMFCKLKKADGFDTQTQKGYYEALLAQWSAMVEQIKTIKGVIDSVYEVGCGSGVNLYLFQRLMNIRKVGGVDYSTALIEIAKQVLKDSDLMCGEAINCLEYPKYDLIIADSVFQYFPDTEYGLCTLEKMWKKSNGTVVITEIHNQSQKEAHLNYRRERVEDYDERYKGLDKTFYSQEMFQKFAKSVKANIKLLKPNNALYWNNDFVFDCYIWK